MMVGLVLAALLGLFALQAGVLAWPRRLPSSSLGAVAVGAVLRLLWVVVATKAPTGSQDPAFYLQIATDLGHGILPRFAGLDPSAYWPPGYPAMLAPFVWFGERTGWISSAFVASLLNVVAGSLTIVFTGRIAETWFGRRAGTVASWLVALCPALVYFTASAHTETVFTTLLLGILVACDAAVRQPSTRRWLGIGALFGLAFLVRSPAVIALAAPAAALRRTGRPWVRPALRSTGLVLAGSLVLLAPWTVRNGVQVGIWTPASTNNASAACYGHNDRAITDWEVALQDVDLQRECFGLSPYDDRRLASLYGDGVPEGIALGTPDEVRWYRERMSAAVRWAVTHPVEELTQIPPRVWQMWQSDEQSVLLVRGLAASEVVGGWDGPLAAVADVWLWGVGLVAIGGLVARRRCRAALGVWLPIALLTLAIAEGVAEPHYRYPVVPLVAVLAAGAVVAAPRVPSS